MKSHKEARGISRFCANIRMSMHILRTPLTLLTYLWIMSLNPRSHWHALPANCHMWNYEMQGQQRPLPWATKQLEIVSPSELYVAVPGVGFMATVCLSLSHPVWCEVFLVHPMYRSYLASFWISFKGSRFVASCGFHVPVEGGDFRNLLGHHLRPEFLKLVFSYILKGVKKWLCLATCNRTLKAMTWTNKRLTFLIYWEVRK